MDKLQSLPEGLYRPEHFLADTKTDSPDVAKATDKTDYAR